MKICFVGLGSIGKRHCENLITYCEEYNIALEIHALRSQSGAGQLPESMQVHINRQVRSIEELDATYDAIFITNPTYCHFDTLVKIANRSRYFFIEKPVFDELDIALTTIPFAKDAVCYVAAPLRHCGVLKKLREIVSPHEVYCARAICSSYLPDWRPNVDYRTIYSASKEAGGGVRIDLIHEWDYLSDLFGFPNEIYQLSGRFSDLEITSEDLAVYIGKYDDKLIEVHLDYFGRETRRSIELFTKKRTIYGDIANACITFSDGTPAIECKEERNIMYMREMQYFMSLVLEQTDHSMNDIEHAMHVLRLALSKESKNK